MEKHCFLEGNSIESALVVKKNWTFIQQTVTFEYRKNSYLIQVLGIYRVVEIKSIQLMNDRRNQNSY